MRWGPSVGMDFSDDRTDSIRTRLLLVSIASDAARLRIASADDAESVAWSLSREVPGSRTPLRPVTAAAAEACSK